MKCNGICEDGKGWGIVFNTDIGRLEIQKCDVCEKYATDSLPQQLLDAQRELAKATQRISKLFPDQKGNVG